MVEKGRNARKPAPLSLGEANRRQPVRPRGRSSRASVLRAARRVFARLGFVDTRVADIVKEAKVAHGSFYTYFDSKEEVLRQIADEVFGTMFDGMEKTSTITDPIGRAIDANRRYAALYEENVSMISVIEQVSAFNDDFRERRTALRTQRAQQVEREIRRIYRETDHKIEDPLDPQIAAWALSGMVDNFLYLWLIVGVPFEREKALLTLDQLWIRALAIESA